jgi:hypothetical protein
MLAWLPAASIGALVGALVVAAVPETQQLTFPSLPAKLQPLVQSQQKKALQSSNEPIWLVQKIPAAFGKALWILAGPQPRFCRSSGCAIHVYLADAGRFRLVGETRGRLADVDESGATLDLRFAEEEAPGQERWHSLTWKGDRYEVAPPLVRFRDPITREWVSADELDRAARDSMKEGHFAAATGRWTLLCHAGCNKEQKELLDTSQVRAGLAPAPRAP